MQRLLILPVAALLVLPAVGCGKVQARAELKKGNSYYQQEQYARALDYFKRGMELDPDATFAWRSVGLSALALYRPGDNDPKNVQYAETAVDAFEKYLADYPDDTKVEEYLLSTYVNARKFDEALAFIDQRIAEKPEETAKLNGYKIRILTQAGRLDQAFQLAEPDPGRRARGRPLLDRRLRLGQGVPRPGDAGLRVEEPARRHGSRRDQEGATTWTRRRSRRWSTTACSSARRRSSRPTAQRAWRSKTRHGPGSRRPSRQGRKPPRNRRRLPLTPRKHR